MKTILSSLVGAALFAAALTGCKKETVVPVPTPSDFFLFAQQENFNAQQDDAKTSMNPSDLSVSWTEGDKISVFCRETGMDTWSDNLQFIISDVSAGKFVPVSGVTVPVVQGKNYDWVAIYPYNPAITSPAGELAIASVQTQESYGNVAHLAASDILKGSANATAAPSIAMHHQGALQKWTIKNTSSASFSLQSVKYSVGSKNWKVNVTTPAAIAKNATAVVYMVTDAMTLNAGDVAEIVMTTSAGECKSKRSFQRFKNFNAGTISTASVDCNPTPTAPTFTVGKNSSGYWRVFKDGAEFFIKGAAANNYYDRLASYGGNVLRTYNITQAKQAIASARGTGVYVLVGLSIGREKDGFDYNNATKVAAQKAKVVAWAQEIYQDPCIMGWIIGNEADASYTNDKVWDAVEDIAKAIKTFDTKHLCTTALAGAKENACTYLKSVGKHIDFLSINSYYPSTQNTCTKMSTNWGKPWIFSEYGPKGTWGLTATTDPPLNSFGYIIEYTSTQKAANYAEIITDDVNANKNKGCIGSCVFVWGYQTHGEVLTWYGTFDKKGYSFPVVDELQNAWTGSYPTYLAPVITNRSSVKIDGTKRADDNPSLKANSSHTAAVTASSPCKAPLTYEWMIYREGTKASDGSLPDGIQGLFVDNTLANVTFNAPRDNGDYRLVVFVRDDAHRKVASAVIPFHVTGGTAGTEGLIDPWTPGEENW